MTSRPFFSVILPTYNRAHTLERAIVSVLAQSFQDFEFFIVDDGSTDETQDIISRYQNIYNIQLKTNGGVSAARNTAAKIASGKWLAFIDSDDEWLPHKLQAQYDFICENPGYFIVHGEEEWIRNGVRVNPKKIHEKGGGDQFYKSCELCIISPSVVVLESASFFEYGMFREDYPVCEDYDLWLKYTEKNEVGYIQEVLVRKYGGHQDQLSMKYKAMDFYRVKSLDYILSSKGVSVQHFEHARVTLVKKCEILLQGYEKHQNMQDYNEVKNLLEMYH